MDALKLIDDTGLTLNATIEIDARGVALHSRSGTDRNRDYRQALELMLRRLDERDIVYQVYLDSQPVQHLPLEKRLLAFNRQAPIAARFDQLIQSMNAGSASRGAWRRILIKPDDADVAEVRSVILANSNSSQVDRLPAAQLRRVNDAHIHKAVARLLAGEQAQNFDPSRDYDVLTDDGTALAPKKVFGLALEEALGIEAHPGHFSAGWSQVCFELLERAGLWIVPKNSSRPRPKPRANEVEEEISSLKPTEEEREWIEGNLQIVSHLKRERRPGLAKLKRAQFIALHGRLFCEECNLDPIATYGNEAGPACIEVHHHRVHVADMQPGHVTVVEDLKCLCANCHRVLHRRLALGLASEV